MTSDTPRTRLEPADRRRDLLAVAETITLEAGLDALTAQSVAERAGASKALVFHYFGSVVGLQRAVTDLAVEALLRATSPAEDLPPEHRPRAVLDAFVTAVTARRALWTDIWRGALRADAPTQAILAAARSALVERTATGVARRAPGGTSERTALLSLGWVALAENITAAWLAGSTLRQDELLDLLVDSLDALLGPSPTRA